MYDNGECFRMLYLAGLGRDVREVMAESAEKPPTALAT